MPTSIYDILVSSRISEESTSLAEHRSKAPLIADVAPRCSLPLPHGELRKLYSRFHLSSVTILKPVRNA